MIESPLIQELMAERTRLDFHRCILQALETRFGAVPPDLVAQLQGIQDEGKLLDLHRQAIVCRDLGEFRTQLLS